MQTVTPPTAVPPVDPRIARSEAAIRAALVGLIGAGRPFETLTVSEVASTAGVTRKTFYARYGGLEPVVVAIVRDVLGGIAAGIDDAALRLPPADDSLAMHIFRAYEAHRDELGQLVSACPAGLFLAPLRDVAGALLDRVITVNRLVPLDPVAQAYVETSVAGVFHAVVTLWTQRGFIEPPERVARMVDALLVDGLQRLIRAAQP